MILTHTDLNAYSHPQEPAVSQTDPPFQASIPPHSSFSSSPSTSSEDSFPLPHSEKASCGSPVETSRGSGDSSLIRFGLKDINTPGRARIHQVSSRRDRLSYLNVFLLYVPFLNCI